MSASNEAQSNNLIPREIPGGGEVVLTQQEINKKRAREYYIKNREKLIAYAKRYKQERIELTKERQRRYRDGNKEKIKQFMKENRHKYDQKYLSNNPEKRKQTVVKWSSKNKHKILAKSNRYRAKKIMAMPKWADNAEIEMIYRMADFMTRYTGIVHEVDHIYPLHGKKVTGLHTHTNLRVIPLIENRKKSNKMPIQEIL